MLISDFVEQLNKFSTAGSAQIKDRFIFDRIKTQYIPVMEKKEEVNRILRLSINEDKNGKYIDLIINEILFIYMIFMSYTDLTVDNCDDEFSSAVKMYDILKSSGVDEEIIPRIGKDLLEYRYVNEQIIELWEKRNYK